MPVEIRVLLMGIVNSVQTGRLEPCSEVKIERKMSIISPLVDRLLQAL